MKAIKTLALISSALLAATIGVSAAPIPNAAQAEATKAVELTTENAALFLPETYEQYLPLVKPTCFAMTETHVAVADGDTIYVCDREKEIYGSFTAQGATITKLQFSDEGRLYYSDSLLCFRELDVTDVSAMTNGDTVYNLTTFCIEGNTVYAMNVLTNETELRALALDGSTNVETCPVFAKIPYNKTPCTTYDNGTLYCAVNSTVYCYDTANAYSLNKIQLDRQNAVSGLTSICFYGGTLYYTEAETSLRDGLYRTDLADETSKCLFNDGGLYAVTQFGGELYCIRESSVLKLSIGEDSAAPSGWEIASSSKEKNRLYEAVSSARAGNLLVTADKGANRVSVYDFSQKAYLSVPCVIDGREFSPSLVATDGEVIAVASESAVYTCTYQNPVLALAAQNYSAVTALTCVYGSVYYTAGTLFGKVGEEGYASHELGSAVFLTHDLYGTIYAANGVGKVFSFDEDEFLLKDGGKSLPLTLPQNVLDFKADFEGNLYYLTEDGLYGWFKTGTSGEKIASVSADSSFVYRKEQKSPDSFALGFEDDRVYFLYGNYAIESLAGTLDVIPTLDKIEIGAAREEVFAPHSTDDLFVTVRAKSIGIIADLDALRDEEDRCFTTKSYYRLKEERRGVLLGKTGDGPLDYSLVALFEADRTTSVNLLRNDALTRSESVFEEKNETKYLVNGVSAYYAPALLRPLSERELSRGDRVTVLGYLDGLDTRYALITLGERTNTGYFLPASFLSVVNPLGTESERFVYGALKAETVFISADGKEIAVAGHTKVKLYETAGGYEAVYEENDVEYRAAVEAGMIYRGESDALRISLIVGLSVLALVIIGTYCYFIPIWKKRNQS